MRKRLFGFAAICSTLVFVLSASGAAFTLDENSPVWLIHHKQVLKLSGKPDLIENEGICVIEMDNRLKFFRVSLSPIYSNQLGPDGLPQSGNLIPNISLLIGFDPHTLIAIAIISAIIPTVWLSIQVKRRATQGFEVRASAPVP